MKKLLIVLIVNFARKRNPNFAISHQITLLTLISKFWGLMLAVIRGLVFRLLGQIKANGTILIEKGVKIEGCGITVGRNTIIERYSRFKSLIPNRIILGKSCRLGMMCDIQIGTQMSDPSGYIHIGDNVSIGSFSHLGGAGGIVIGDGSIIGSYLSIHSENHGFDPDKGDFRNQEVEKTGVKVGTNVWIGSKVTILDGVSIGSDSVVASGAVVTKSFDKGSLIAGVPARKIKDIGKD